MSERLRSLKRVHKVQAQVKRLAEARLATIERRKDELDTALRDIGDFLNDSATIGDLAAQAIRQAQRLAVREATTERERAVQAKVLYEAQSRLTMMEHQVEDLDREHRRTEERRDLERILDAFANRPPEPA